ncbi:hypothetical protein ADN01_16305 [Levilinea saccharolytica]|uniref:Uncharacterized protein n=1 Tax=Levilinea saccharolytica TaxID=229921 RepID=A0A0P6XVG6_9CHLR|nr:hypothetical protein ADN01_16305 [Levilinea saccharolytica]
MFFHQNTLRQQLYFLKDFLLNDCCLAIEEEQILFHQLHHLHNTHNDILQKTLKQNNAFHYAPEWVFDTPNTQVFSLENQ